MNDAARPDPDRHSWLLDQYTELASLAGGLAHEIKNPLSTLNLNLQLLAEDFTEGASAKETRALKKIQTLQKECQRLEDILNDFLRFARVCDLIQKPTEVHTLVREMIAFQWPRLAAKGIVVRDDLQPVPMVPLDGDFFRQAILNLLLNAEQAMPAGGELIVRTRADANSVTVEVIDTGEGMSPETLEKIYRPFYSTRAGGSGLGLPTTKKIIEAHHGALEVASEPGKGTAFTIRLPRDQKQAGTAGTS